MLKHAAQTSGTLRREVAAEDTLSIRGHSWDFIADAISRSPHEMRVTASFLCELTREQQAHAIEMRLENRRTPLQIEQRAQRRAISSEPS